MDDVERLGLIADGIVNGAEFEAICEEHPAIADTMRKDLGLAYSTLCPKCAGLLLAFEDQPDTAPWLCESCSLGFWTAEITDLARECYVPPLEWRGAQGVGVRRAVQLERLQAHQRGCSLRIDQLRLLDDEGLTGILRRHGARLHPEFRGAIEREIEGRG